MRIKARKKSGRLFTQRLVLHWGVQLLQAMAYLEQRSITHGAVRPEHIFLKHGAKIVKLGEFSHAQQLCGRESSEDDNDDVKGHSQRPSTSTSAPCDVESVQISTLPLAKLAYLSPELLAQGSPLQQQASIKGDAWFVSKNQFTATVELPRGGAAVKYDLTLCI